MPPRIGLTLLLTAGYRAAAGPLLAEGRVDALEWEADAGFHGGDDDRPPPAWAERVLALYEADDALYGHAVWLSVFSARWQDRQDRWLARFAAECRRRRYRRVSEHLGFMTAGEVVRNASLPVPLTTATVEVGRRRVAQLADAAGVPVGLENQACGLSPRDALDQGELLDRVLRPSGGFLVLDVHNIYTQAVNFGLDPLALLDRYPLDLAVELHVSGGQWFRCRDGAQVLLDSHDTPVPFPVFELAAHALRRCPNLEVVFLERRDGTLDAPAEIASYQDDYRALVHLVDQVCAPRPEPS